MGKWAWRAIGGEDTLWLDIVKGGDRRLGGGLSGVALIKPERRVRGWWGEVLDCIRDNKGEWFEEALTRDVGNGLNTSFWEDRWVGESTLRARFPRLFELSLDKASSVAEAGVWIGQEWWWGEGWRRSLREWELNLLSSLTNVLECRKSSQNEEDRWSWKPEQTGCYSVKSAYILLMERKSEIQGRNMITSKLIWENWAVPKAQASAWRIVFRRVATKAALSRRGILGPNLSLVCPLCGYADETNNHLFVECRIVWSLRSKCLEWLGLYAPLANSVQENLVQFCFLRKGKRRQKFLATVWVCMSWLIWKHRNDLIFNGGSWKEDKVLGEMKSLLWFWINGAKGDISVRMNFGEWCSNPWGKVMGD